MTDSNGPVTVGVDGSVHSRRAAAWATAEAQRYGAPLHLVLVNDDPARSDYAENTLTNIANQCRDNASELEVHGEVAEGHPVEELLRRSERSRFLVLGSRGHGGFVKALIGSKSATVATHAACPVVVVRGEGPADTGPVIVGVDNSAGSEAALDFAFDAADRRGTGLVAVQALPDSYFTPVPFPPAQRERIREHAEQQLSVQLADWAKRHPNVSASRTLSELHPVPALCDAAENAQLLVVGHRGRGGFEGMLLGSTAHGVLQHAPCPVAVVRH